LRKNLDIKVIGILLELNNLRRIKNFRNRRKILDYNPFESRKMQKERAVE